MTAPPAAEALLPALVELAAEAVRVIMNVYGRPFTVERKADRSPLAEADLAARHVIAAGLAALTPPLPELSEEAADGYLRLGATSERDTAAAQCVVEEAGGALSDLRLRALRYNTKDSLLNPYFIVHGDVDHDWRRYLTAVQR